MSESLKPIPDDRRVLVFMNQKGGVAKTTSVINIGDNLARKGYKVLLIDLDPQANLTSNFIEEELENTVFEELKLFSSQAAGSDHSFDLLMTRENLYLLPSDISLAGIDPYINAAMEPNKVLLQIIRRIKARKFFDFILVDCPPNLGALPRNALTAAELLFIPVTPEPFPVKGLRQLQETIELIRENLNPRLRIDGIIITRVEGAGRVYSNFIKSISEEYSDRVLKPYVRKNCRISEAQEAHRTVFEHDPSCNGVEDYAGLTDTILDVVLDGGKNNNEQI